MIMAWAGATVAWLGAVVSANTTRKSKTNTVEVCQCKHGAAFHDGAGCQTVIEQGRVTEYNYAGIPVAWKPAKCTCVRYVGPSTSYLPELDGPSSPLNLPSPRDGERR